MARRRRNTRRSSQKGGIAVEYGVVTSGLSIVLLLLVFGARQDLGALLHLF